MATIGAVKDLTRRSGSLTFVGNNALELNTATMPDPFLDEVWVSNTMKACYFSHNFTIQPQIDEYFFEIGLINIPKGFQFIEYMANGATTPDWNNKKKAIEKTIYGHVLLNISSTTPTTNRLFHLCENPLPENRGGGILMDKTTQGCATPLLSNPDDKAYPFLLFYYFGKIYFSDNSSNEDVEKLTPSGWYLIPLVLSERITVYYVIPEDKVLNLHIEKLNNLYKNLPIYLSVQSGCYSIGITERLQLNDKLGIFITGSLLNLP